MWRGHSCLPQRDSSRRFSPCLDSTLWASQSGLRFDTQSVGLRDLFQEAEGREPIRPAVALHIYAGPLTAGNFDKNNLAKLKRPNNIEIRAGTFSQPQSAAGNDSISVPGVVWWRRDNGFQPKAPKVGTRRIVVIKIDSEAAQGCRGRPL